MHIGVAGFAHGADGKLMPVAEWESAAFRSIGSADENIDPAAEVPDNWAWDFLPRCGFLPLEQETDVDCKFKGLQTVVPALTITAVQSVERIKEACIVYDIYNKQQLHLARITDVAPVIQQ
ncbi:uncharacterized protein LY79DRAFT_661827 [Colletotrichum navitas]|uniref:Uncharacterized protein n=1 Tax=Colletotrichum navitas TaxID=681940 RepID=A0AAD8PRK1_9PEZI|nr:uncharacterized protein LY79DRAFT_661827 [Colletotrichum navitas]KAK1579356.1 hypothetical protein LY79DRAFT_661827 [Colletotrichum navitas]